MKLSREHKKLLTLIMLSVIALILIYVSISFIQLTFNPSNWWAGSRIALIIIWMVFTVFTGINLYSEDD